MLVVYKVKVTHIHLACLGMHDFVVYKLTGTYASDMSGCACGVHGDRQTDTHTSDMPGNACGTCICIQGDTRILYIWRILYLAIDTCDEQGERHT